jgi:hypothetical protein
MPVQPINALVQAQARLLAADNRKAEPDISRIFWFPDGEEVRLIEVTEQIPISSEGEVIPFYFRAAPVRCPSRTRPGRRSAWRIGSSVDSY